MSIGDLSAGVAAVRIAAERLGDIVERYGLAATIETFTAVLACAEKIAREALRRIPPVSMRQTTSSTETASVKIRSCSESVSPSPRRSSSPTSRNGAPDQWSDQLRPRRPHVRL